MNPLTSWIIIISWEFPSLGGAYRLPRKFEQSSETNVHPAASASSTVLGWSVNAPKGLIANLVFKLYQFWPPPKIAKVGLAAMAKITKNIELPLNIFRLQPH